MVNTIDVVEKSASVNVANLNSSRYNKNTIDVVEKSASASMVITINVVPSAVVEEDMRTMEADSSSARGVTSGVTGGVSARDASVAATRAM